MQDGTFLKPDYPEVPQEPQGYRERFEVKGDCGMVSDLLSRIGDKWSILVVAILSDRTLRFNELRREVGTISQKMLTATLRNLERDGFVERTVYPTIPPKVEYKLTELGQDLLCPVDALGRWAKANAKRVFQAREQFDREAG
jgi:DNA-binding HxlR family transcriptional regulator